MNQLKAWLLQLHVQRVQQDSEASQGSTGAAGSMVTVHRATLLCQRGDGRVKHQLTKIKTACAVQQSEPPTLHIAELLGHTFGTTSAPPHWAPSHCAGRSAPAHTHSLPVQSCQIGHCTWHHMEMCMMDKGKLFLTLSLTTRLLTNMTVKKKAFLGNLAGVVANSEVQHT